MTGILYIVATPIGNLEDITLRGIKILSEVDVILAEDTRVTRNLINSQFSIHNFQTVEERNPNLQLISYHQHSNDVRKLEIAKILMDGKNIALVTDAGTPGISDPGNELVSFLLDNIDELKVIPIPGPSAITALLSVSGIDASKFIFLGFWPKKKASKVIEVIESTKFPVVFYESPFRIVKTLKLISGKFGGDKKVILGRELTKLYETIYRGTIDDVIDRLKTQTVKGEIVVILNR